MTILKNNGKSFQPVPFPKLINPNIEKFHYVYKEKEIIYGHVVWHVGDGIYMFQEPIELKGNRETIRAELKAQYPDLAFYEFWDRYEGRKEECILFVISRTNRIICNYAYFNRVKMKLDAAGNYAGPAAVEYLWNKFGSQYKSGFAIACCWCAGSSSRFKEKEAIEAGSGLLQFEFDPDCIEECGGYKKYILLGGSVGVMIGEGIYCFSPPDEESMVGIGDYIAPGDYLPAEVWLTSHGKQTIMDFEGTIGMLLDEHYNAGKVVGFAIRYLAFGKEAAEQLRKLGEHLERYRWHRGRYEFRICQRKKNGTRYVLENTSPIFDVSLAIALLLKWEGDPKLETCEQPIEEDAVELLEGVGLAGLKVILKLAFQQEGVKCYCEYAYALKDYVVLGVKMEENKIEKYIVPICIISELRVIVKMNLFGVTTENFSVPVIKNECIEGLFMPKEMCQHYEKMSKTLNSIKKLMKD